MVNPDLIEVMGTVLTVAHDTPVPRRIRLYRGLAGVCADPEEQSALLRMADSLAKVEADCRAFEFSFVRNNSSKEQS